MALKRSISLFGSIVLSAGISVPAFASFDFSPIIATMAPSGQKATVSFQATNLENVKIPIQISIVAREPDINGNEEYKESEKVEEQFRIYPDQIVLNPKETRTVRVTWIGNPKLSVEAPFRILVEEIPVDVNDPNKVYTKAVARVGISTKYVGSLYVSPNGVKSNLIVEAKKSDSSKELIVDLINKGTAHQVIKKPILKIQSQTVGSSEIVLSPTEIPSMINQNIMPGRSRRFSVPWPKNLPEGPLKATLDLVKE